LTSGVSAGAFPSAQGLFNDKLGLRLDTTSTTATCAMQETVAMALAHSYGFGFVVLDNSILTNVRNRLLQTNLFEVDSPALKTSALVAFLCRSAKQITTVDDKFASATLSTLLAKDATTEGPGVPGKAAAASAASQLQLESSLLFPSDPFPSDPTSTSTSTSTPPPPLIFLPPHSSSSILRSKTSIDLLTKELSDPSTTNLLILGHEQSPSSLIAKLTPPEADDSANHNSQEDDPNDMNAMSREILNKLRNNPSFNPMMNNFNPNMPNGMGMGMGMNNGMHMNNGVNPLPNSAAEQAHRQTLANGENDPIGSKRFNIFIARQLKPGGGGGYLGALASPKMGNPFQLRSFHNFLSTKNQNDQFNLNNPLMNMIQVPGLTSFDREMTAEQIQQAMTAWIDKLFEQIVSSAENFKSLNKDGGPKTLIETFADLLKDERMKAGIAQNLAKAAPALSDTRCMGVQLR